MSQFMRAVSGFLSSCQLLMLLLAGVFWLAGHSLSWWIILWPVEVMVAIGVVFWVIVFGLVRLAGRLFG